MTKKRTLLNTSKVPLVVSFISGIVLSLSAILMVTKKMPSIAPSTHQEQITSVSPIELNYESKSLYPIFYAPKLQELMKNEDHEYLSCADNDVFLTFGYDFEKEYMDQDDSSRVDSKLLEGFKQIVSHKYTKILHDQNGGIIQTDQSEQEISIQEICSDETNYYILLLTQGEKISGGYSGESNLAIIDETGNTTIIENIYQTNKKINVPGMGTERAIAYFGCWDIEGKMGDHLLILCGGGDGPGGGSTINDFLVSEKTFSEVAVCLSQFNEENCYDHTGKVYYTYTKE